MRITVELRPEDVFTVLMALTDMQADMDTQNGRYAEWDEDDKALYATSSLLVKQLKYEPQARPNFGTRTAV